MLSLLITRLALLESLGPTLVPEPPLGEQRGNKDPLPSPAIGLPLGKRGEGTEVLFPLLFPGRRW